MRDFSIFNFFKSYKMKRNILNCLFLFVVNLIIAQETIDNINLDTIEPNQTKQFWLILIDDGFSQPVSVPVLIAKGKYPGPILGLTAAIHGNELNGIKVIQKLFEDINTEELHGTIIAIPGLNNLSIQQDKRLFIDDDDLNRNFPGKANGNNSQQYVYQINKKIISKIEYLIDMHTASFGRVNSLYVRADMNDEKMKNMALLQDADIVLNSKGPSAGVASEGGTIRDEAMSQGIPSITIEYGNPQVYQSDMIERGVIGVKNVMSWLKMQNFEVSKREIAVRCKKSYWIYVDKGGLLEVPVELNQMVEKGEVIGILRNPFGDIIKEYTCPEKGIVIGKSTNPVNTNGGRIIHLGILEN